MTFSVCVLVGLGGFRPPPVSSWGVATMTEGPKPAPERVRGTILGPEWAKVGQHGHRLWACCRKYGPSLATALQPVLVLGSHRGVMRCVDGVGPRWGGEVGGGACQVRTTDPNWLQWAPSGAAQSPTSAVTGTSPGERASRLNFRRCVSPLGEGGRVGGRGGGSHLASGSSTRCRTCCNSGGWWGRNPTGWRSPGLGC